MDFAKKRALYSPLIIINAIIILTLILFKCGTIEWLTPNTDLVVVFVLAVYVFFSAGYIFIIKKQKPLNDDYVRFDFFKAARILFIIGVVAALAYYTADMVITYGKYIFKYAQYPGASYDYAEYMQRLSTQGAGVDYPMWFRYITRFHTLCFGLVLSGITWGLFYWKRFKLAEKILWVVLLLVYLFRSWLLAAQSSFFMLLFIGITYFCYKLYITLNSEESRKSKARKISIQSLLIVLTAVCCLGVVYIFQHDRSIQREIREDLRTSIINKGYEFNEDVYEKTVLHSINIRLKEQIFYVQYGNDGTTTATDISQNVAPRKGAEVLKMGDIDKYFKVDKENSIVYKIEPKLYFAVQSLSLYITQGYGALGLAFEHDFTWTYFIGNSRFLSQFVDDHLGTHIFENTYIYKNEKVFDWSSTTFWQSLYTWLASDFTFYGVIIVFGFIGMLFAKVWLEVIKYRNPFAFALMFMMVFGIMMASANNLLFQDLGLCIATVSIIMLFVLSLIIRKRKVLKIRKLANEK